MTSIRDVLEIQAIIDQVKSFATSDLAKDQLDKSQWISSRLELLRVQDQVKSVLRLLEMDEAPQFQGLWDLTPAITRAQKGMVLEGCDLAKIMVFSFGLDSLVHYGRQKANRLGDLVDIFESLPDLKKLALALSKRFDSDGSLKPDASPKLIELDQALVHNQEVIQERTASFLKAHADLLAERFTTLRSNRVVVALLSSYKNKLNGIVHDQSQTGLTTYFEPQFLVDLNNRHQVLLNDLDQERYRLCQEASQWVAQEAFLLLAGLDSAVSLDSLFARGLWAHRRQGVMAEIDNQEGFYLEEVVHPLLEEKTAKKNTFRLGDPQTMMLMTGPNTGGKSVALKTIGSSIYLTYCGFPILAQKARLGYFDHLFMDVGDNQSITSSLSTFSAHLVNVQTILDQATSQSLVLLDELGSATDPQEGQVLAQAIVEYLLDKGIYSVVTTHFQALKRLASEDTRILNASMQFDLDRLMPTYRYLEGVAGASYALDIAQRLHLNPTVLDRAKALKEERVSDQDRLLKDLDEALSQQVQIKEALEEEKERLAKVVKEAQADKEAFEKEKESLLVAWTLKEKNKIQKTLAQARALLSHLEETSDKQEGRKVYQALEELGGKPLEKGDKHARFDLGDKVRLVNTNQIGEVVEVGKKDLVLLVNGLRVKTRPDKVLAAKNQVVVSRPKPVKSISYEIQPLASLELNIIGMRRQEAKEALEAFLDQARVNNAHQVRIVHGFGQGILRDLVHETLKKDKRIASFDYAGEGQGGQGATLAIFQS